MICKCYRCDARTIDYIHGMLNISPLACSQEPPVFSSIITHTDFPQSRLVIYLYLATFMPNSFFTFEVVLRIICLVFVLRKEKFSVDSLLA
jgi:hypothetical protein